MTIKTKNTIGWILTVLVGFAMVFSGFSKVTNMEMIAAHLKEMGVDHYTRLLGVVTLLFAALFLYPKTMKIGFLLLSCYWSGAVAVEFSHGAIGPGLVALLVVLWIAAYLREPAIFLKRDSDQQPVPLRKI